MFTLDPLTLFFYSRITSFNDQDQPPSKKRRATRDPIYTWIDNVPPNAPPPSVAGSKTTALFKPPPSLTAGSTRTSSNSAPTNNTRITQKIQPRNVVTKEPKEAIITVEDNGIYSDYDETTGLERDKAVASSPKRGARATSSVGPTHIFSIKFTTYL